MSLSNTTKVMVRDLRVGMYVSRLDRDWLDTPFLLQGFHIEEYDDIETVAEYCEYVWVDESRSLKIDTNPEGTATRGPGASEEHYADTPVAEEHRRMFGTFRQARSLTKSMLDDIRLGGTINTEIARQTVNDCVQSVIRHPDALLWMSRMRNENEYTAEHCLNVCILAIAFGRSLGMQEQDLTNLGMCGLLHDVGKMKIPAEVLDKPDRLTREEMTIMMSHTIHGRNLLLSSPDIFSGTIDVAFSHHERIDGNGYPRRLAGANISRLARIIAIVDAYDAMTADRCYQTAKTSTEALKIIYNARGVHFDEQLALKFIQTIGLYPAGSVVELHSGEVGLVIETNRRIRHLPRVLVVTDNEKKPLSKERVIDLSLIENGQLSGEYLIKQVWKDNSFGVSLRNYREKGLVIRG